MGIDDKTNDQKPKREIITGHMDMIKEFLCANSRADFLIEYQNISASWSDRYRRYIKKIIHQQLTN